MHLRVFDMMLTTRDKQTRRSMSVMNSTFDARYSFCFLTCTKSTFPSKPK
ncbi:unnamed protein product [Ixodes pacificus]